MEQATACTLLWELRQLATSSALTTAPTLCSRHTQTAHADDQRAAADGDTLTTRTRMALGLREQMALGLRQQMAAVCNLPQSSSTRTIVASKSVDRLKTFAVWDDRPT